MGGDIDATTITAVPGASDVRSPTQVTDVHQSKIPADDPRLRLGRPRPRTLKRGPVLLIGATLAGVLAVGLVAGLGGSPKEAESSIRGPAANEVPHENPPLPDVIKDPPSDAERSPASASVGGKHAPTSGSSPPPASGAAADGLPTLRQSDDDELIKARAGAIFIAGAEGTLPPHTPPVGLTRGSDSDRGPTGRSARGTGTATADPNLQERKNDFLARAGVSGAEALEKPLSVPRSPYEVKAGSVIPTVLITGINSDLPGQVVAQVRENVYDTVTGNHLLIPQGSRLLAAYDSMVAWGQQRVLVCWNRLIRPDGTSMSLDCMPGVDLAGYAGFSDEVDNHWWRIIGGAAVSSLLAATAQRTQGNVTGYQPTLAQSWASGTAGGINEAGQQLTAKNLQLQPTITVRRGFSVNVLVTKDIVIAPYTPPAAP